MSSQFDSGEQMSLNGNLEVFPLEEVLRLLARSRKSGCLRVDSAEAQGRVFLSNGALTLATTATDDQIRRRLVSSGLVRESDLRKIELSGASISDALAPGVEAGSLADFVREESIEGLYRIRRGGRGNFDFVVDLTPRYPSGQSFDSEVVLSEADRRSLEWEDVLSVLPDLDRVLRMVRSLPDEESVTLSPSTWQILAALGDGSSTARVAQTIGWSDFRTAREMASLVRNGLVEIVHGVDSPVTPVPEVVDDVPAPPPVEPEPELPVAGSEAAVLEPDLPAPVVEAPIASEPELPASPPEVPTEELELPAAMAEPAEESLEPSAAMDDAPEGDQAEAPAQPWVREPQEQVEAPVETPAEAPEPAEEPREQAASSWWSDEPASPVAEEEADEPDTPWGASPWKADEPAEEPVIQTSPWGSPVADVSPEPPTAPEPTTAPEPPSQPAEGGHEATRREPVATADEAEEDRTRGWWAETMGAAEEAQGSTDNEADRFLESVFSSLSDDEEDTAESSDAEEDETGFGMGLLRRRRMGAAARDISDNDR